MNFIERLKGAARVMFGRNAFTMAGLPATALSDISASKIELWRDIYADKSPWLSRNKLTLGVAPLVCKSLATLATLECGINVSDTSEQERIATAAEGSLAMTQKQGALTRAQAIDAAFEQVRTELRQRAEVALALGGMAFKPVFTGNEIHIDFVAADSFYPVSYSAAGEITGAVFIEKKRRKDKTYFRVETHEMGKDGAYTITNRAFRSEGGGGMGVSCQLAEVEEWARIQPEVTLSNITSPLFAYFKVPGANREYPDSPLGVSVFSAAESSGTLEEADRQFQRLMWEFEGGELAIDASQDAFKTRRLEDGKFVPTLPEGKERLYRVNTLMQEGGSEGIFSTFNPALRDANFINGLNEILMRIEDQCGVARGTLSDISEISRTATELRISRQRTYATVTGIQGALERALAKLAGAIDELCDLYAITPAGAWDIAFAWDDSVVTDADTERERDLNEVRERLMMPWEYRVKWYGESEEEAKARLAENAEKDLEAALAEKTKERLPRG
ncbi:MAG: hypothetical protein K5663_11330 [Clostridiales bacterium]|nr:hypothetical protein [Clostridiales bacterium]